MVAVLFGAAAMRLAPLLDFTLWGSDWGEYYHLTDQLVDGGTHPEGNLGWGKAYVDFPGFFDLAGGISLALGIDAGTAVLLVMPCVTAISCLVVACMVLRLGGGPWAALFSALFLAFVFPEVFQNSHPAPGPLGSVLFLAVLLVFLLGDAWRRETDGDVPRPMGLHVLLLLLAMAMAATHHLSLFFALIAVLLAHYLRAALVRGVEPDREAWGAWAVVALMTLATVFWLVLAPTFREEVMIDLAGLPGWASIVLAWSGVVVVLAAARVHTRREGIMPGLGRKPPNAPYSGSAGLGLLLLAFIVSGLVIMTLVALFGFPGTTIEPDPLMIVYFAPILVVFALGVGSTDMVLRAHGGHAVVAWVLAIVGSFLAAIAVSSQVLISYRHLPYVAEVAAVLIGFGAWHLRRLALPKGARVSWAYGTACALLMVALVATAFPPKDIMGGFEEGTTEQELGAALWLREGLPSPGADPGDASAGAVVSDHRLSSMAFGIGDQMATWDNAGDTLHRPLDDLVLAELEGVETPQGERPVTAVLVSEDVRSGAALLQWEGARPIGKEAWDKLFEEPFVRLYDGGEVWVFGVARPLQP